MEKHSFITRKIVYPLTPRSLSKFAFSTIMDDTLYQNGVSNGDVDWLFRGKSKKLTKKMIQNKEEDKSKDGEKGSIDKDSSETDKGKVRTEVRDEVIDKVSSANKSDVIDKVQKERGTEVGKKEVGKKEEKSLPTPTESKLSSSLKNAEVKKPEKEADKSTLGLFRPRSSSVSNQGAPVSKPSVNSKSNAIPINNRSRSSSTSSQTSNSSLPKKSLFSSISSKFKSESSSPTNSFLGANNSTPSLLTGYSIDHELERKPTNDGSPILNSFFKRRSSTSRRSSVQMDPQLLPKDSRESRDSRDSETCEIHEPKEKSKPSDIDELKKITLKRVNFSIDKLSYDPQQQIPSRRPKKGNVLIPEDLTAPPPRLSQGISLNDGSTKSETAPKYSEKELNLAIEAQKRALIEAEKHAQEAHLSAKRLAVEVTQFKKRRNTLTTPAKDDVEDDVNVKKIEIDKPLHMHEENFGEETEIDIKNLTLEQIYTRCCHLREILPIPATLKQLKNKTKPLQVLKLLNPKPTLIDILSFSDFIAIIPISTIIFDNVTMTTEMLKNILGSIVNNKTLEKLSLRNVPIDNEGWGYLCKFLSQNKSIKKLDISQQRIKPDLNKSFIRSSLNWNLFIEALSIRGGIEELVINGCKITDECFKDLTNKGLTNTMRLGIASCELNNYKSNVVCNWLKKSETKCIGVDIAFNDLSKGQLTYFIDAFNSGNVNLIFFSLYQTNLSSIEEFTELLKSLIRVKTLRFLDLSSLPSLFPGVISKLNTYLPHFENLKRIHFDLNDLSSQSIIAITEILPKINGLFHVSFLGNRNLNNSVGASIYAAIKKSNSIHTLDLDYDLINDQLNQKIAFYLMRNMNNFIETPSTTTKPIDNDDDQEELMFDGSLLMEAAEKLLIENDTKPNKVEDIKLQRIISNALIERTTEIRLSIHKTIDVLFTKRNNGTLSLEGKESLLRFCLLDSSLEQLVHMFEEQSKKLSMSPSPSLELNNDEKTHPNIQLDDKLLHHNSTELITSGPILSPRNTETLNKLGYFTNDQSNFEPHQVVVESSKDGKNIPIDYLTGRPVLMRSISQTSTHAKEQELEEGEFHRWGFFIEQRNNSSNNLEEETKKIPTLKVLPSGNELRDAIIKAKGIESITELINKINNDRVSLDKIYDISDDQKEQVLRTLEQMKLEEKTDDDDNASIDSNEDSKVDAVVDEAYDKLLNDAQRVRSNK